ncbi:MAG: glycosyltransferase family 2 protein [Bacteroides sp.]|nr:glycosyltransferase family 2 protein [Roseburia sp.]MCM1345988.1 glycosyltransferase family 2 protein [Bacteroides sp.]MCM1420853.1 glycosyltransferase family 2 protein [Bacteroides sp.]
MLSILIPCYNYDCRQLVSSLQRQGESLESDYEIIVGDDASDNAEIVSRNKEINALPHCVYSISEKNLGRAENRNRMAEMAAGDWLLFIDCDARVCSDSFLRNYMAATGNACVVCGGLCHPPVSPCPTATLRYKYERQADCRRAASIRSRNPYMQLSAFNLMIRKEVFMSVKFDKDCREYGYEDALMGVELYKRGIEILHIDNPIMHVGLEPNDVFLGKSETALRTLYGLKGKMGNHSHVENMANRLRRLHADKMYTLFYRIFRKSMKRNLLGDSPSLFVFSLYKLGFFLDLGTEGLE